jgi:hypothetical protein
MHSPGKLLARTAPNPPTAARDLTGATVTGFLYEEGNINNLFDPAYNGAAILCDNTDVSPDRSCIKWQSNVDVPIDGSLTEFAAIAGTINDDGTCDFLTCDLRLDYLDINTLGGIALYVQRPSGQFLASEYILNSTSLKQFGSFVGPTTNNIPPEVPITLSAQDLADGVFKISIPTFDIPSTGGTPSSFLQLSLVSAPALHECCTQHNPG